MTIKEIIMFIVVLLLIIAFAFAMEFLDFWLKSNLILLILENGG